MPRWSPRATDDLEETLAFRHRRTTRSVLPKAFADERFAFYGTTL